MNKTNNSRKQKSRQKIKDAYVALVLENKDPSFITVSDVCKKAQINRSTFYGHYLDMDDLYADVCAWLVTRFKKLFEDGAETKEGTFDFLKLFRCIKEDPSFFETCFRLNADVKSVFVPEGFSSVGAKIYDDPIRLEYHVAFFEAGMMAITRKWLDSGCKESPEEMAQILREEYNR